MSELLTPRVSDAARAKIQADFDHLPETAAEILGGWLTLIEECDERWRKRWYPDPAKSTAMEMGEGISHMTSRQQADERRTWAAEREVLIRGATDLLAIYPKPQIVSAPFSPQKRGPSA